MKILDRLPVTSDHILLNVPGGRLRVKPCQIIVNISISSVPTWDAATPIIPILLDTGNNHNLSIQEDHLRKWAGIHPASLPSLRLMREGGRTASLRLETVWVHLNQLGRRELRGVTPVKLKLEEGIAIYPSEESNYPRIPTLGLRAILKNKLKLVIDGKRNHVSLRTSFW
jgi:hypothetical protein